LVSIGGRRSDECSGVNESASFVTNGRVEEGPDRVHIRSVKAGLSRKSLAWAICFRPAVGSRAAKRGRVQFIDEESALEGAAVAARMSKSLGNPVWLGSQIRKQSQSRSSKWRVNRDSV
jgi:hypothetical protein